MSNEQKLKDGDRIIAHYEVTNKTDLLFFTNQCQVYKTKASAFDDTKASVLGDYIPVKLGFDENESLVYMAVTDNYEGYMLFFFKNGKAAKVYLSSYATKTNRKNLPMRIQESMSLFISVRSMKILTLSQNHLPEKL